MIFLTQGAAMGAALEKKRDAAVIAHAGDGKTTLAEAMLFSAEAALPVSGPRC